MQDFDKILERVRKLLALAEHPNTPPHEADLSRNRAEALMFQHRIEEATMVANGLFKGENSVTPAWRVLGLNNTDSEFGSAYRMIGGAVVHHVGAKAVIDYNMDTRTVVMNACGYESDLRYLEILLTSCVLEFSKRLEPKHDPNLSDQENAYLMRSAGMERKRIAKILFGDWSSENEMKAKNRKVSNLIKKECEKLGEDASLLLGRGNNMKTYRDSYADGFVQTINQRLWRMRMAAGEDNGALVLADRAEKVQESFYERYPQYRPQPVNPNAKPMKFRAAKPRQKTVNGRAYDRGSVAALNVDLGPNATGKGRMSGGNSNPKGAL